MLKKYNDCIKTSMTQSSQLLFGSLLQYLILSGSKNRQNNLKIFYASVMSQQKTKMKFKQIYQKDLVKIELAKTIKKIIQKFCKKTFKQTNFNVKEF